MKKILTLIVLFITICSFPSCLTQQGCSKKFPCKGDTITVINTETITITKHDTIEVAGETITITKTVDCDKNGKAQMPKTTIKGRKGKVDAEIKDGVFTADCVIDSAAIAIEWQETHKITTKDKKITVVNSPYEKTGWEKFKEGLRDSGLYILFLIVGFVIGFISSKFLKLLP